MKRRIFLNSLACLLAFTSFTADAHPGRLDANGGYHEDVYAGLAVKI